MNRWRTSRFTFWEWLMKKREYMYMLDELYIKCNRCWKWKMSKCYRPAKAYKFWVLAECRECESEYNRNRYESKREEITATHKEYYRKNKEKINSHKREYYKRTNKQWEYRKRQTEELWFNRHTFHVRASDYVNEHSLRPERCSICGSRGTVEMHHPSYEKYEYWSMVVFCCRSCHKQIHSWRIQSPTPINLLDLETVWVY